MVKEARLEEAENGKSATEDGWFTLHVSEAPWVANERFGGGARFEGNTRFAEIGVHVRVLEPGVPACLYHRESAQEDFYVLEGECLFIVEEEERPLRKGHFAHCPAGTNHVFVGAGEGPCVILMIGARPESHDLVYPVSEVAGKYGGSVETETTNPVEAYGEMDLVPVAEPLYRGG